MDFNLPRNTLPEANGWLSPPMQQFDQWIRLTAASALSLTLFAPVLRAVTLNMGQREHRRQGRFVPPPQGPFLPFSSTVDAIKQVWTKEGWKGYFRGTGCLYIVLPIRAAYHILLFNHIETYDPNALRSNHRLHSLEVKTTTERKIPPEMDKKKSQNQIVAEALNQHLSPSSTANTSNSTTEMSESSFLLRTLGIIVVGEAFLYPARWAFTRISGDLLGPQKTILSPQSTSLIKHTIRTEGIFALYRGFFPCLIAVALPALAFANSRYNTHNNAFREQYLAQLEHETTQNQKYNDPNETALQPASTTTNAMEIMQQTSSLAVKDSKFSTAWILAMVLVYPIIGIHVRMVIGNQSRVPKDHVMKHASPLLRQLVANFLPSRSTSSNSDFKSTYLRVLEGGPGSAYTSFGLVLGLRILFEISADIFASVAGWPLNLLANNQLFGIYSISTPRNTQAALAAEDSLEMERQKMLSQILTLHDTLSGSLQTEPTETVTERDPRRYEDNENALEILGLNPVMPAKMRYPTSNTEELRSNGTGRPKSKAELLDETPLSVLAAESPLGRMSPSADPNTRQSPKTSSEAPFSAPSDSPAPPSSPVPLLSQELPWYSSNSRETPTKPL